MDNRIFILIYNIYFAMNHATSCILTTVYLPITGITDEANSWQVSTSFDARAETLFNCSDHLLREVSVAVLAMCGYYSLLAPAKKPLMQLQFVNSSFTIN